MCHCLFVFVLIHFLVVILNSVLKGSYKIKSDNSGLLYINYHPNTDESVLGTGEFYPDS